MSVQVNEHIVLSKCESFVDYHLWPLYEKLNPRDWLSNFKDTEQEMAVHLLNAFIYFSDIITDQLFITAFLGLSRTLRPLHPSYVRNKNAWSYFIDNILVTHVTGEIPNTTDSGYAFARRSRQLLGIQEDRIVEPGDAIVLMYRNAPTPWPVVFVDDFVGSGNQFRDTWFREYRVTPKKTTSFAELSKNRGQRFFYTPVICTSKGKATIERACPEVLLCPAHVVPENYSAIVADSVVWPLTLRSQARDFIYEVSQRAGIPDTDGTDTSDWQGFHKLGLTLAFAHSIPDATLPIFYWQSNGWKPLLRKT